MNLSAVINLQLVMFALFICGFILTRKGVINSERRKGMSDLLIDLFLPANIICAFLTGISRDVFAEAFQVLVIALGIQIISYLLGLILYRKEVNGRRMVLRYATIWFQCRIYGKSGSGRDLWFPGLTVCFCLSDPLKNLYVVCRSFLLYSGKSKGYCKKTGPSSLYHCSSYRYGPDAIS